MTTIEKLAMKKFQLIDFHTEKRKLQRYSLELQQIHDEIRRQFNMIVNILRGFGIADEHSQITIDISDDRRVICRADNNPGIYFVKRVLIDKDNYVRLYLENRDDKNDANWYNMIATNVDWTHLMYILFEYIEDYRVL